MTDNPNPDSASRLLRTDDATGAAAFTNLSSSDPSSPGFGSFDFCQAQCSYDMFVASPPGHPNTVWLGGSMQYGELSLYAGPDMSDGRAVVRSTDGGVNWNDMTGDNRTDFEDQHPDQHAIAFVPGNPDIAFVGSDGGMIRTDGKFGNASAQCDSRDLDGTDLANCHAWLSQVPQPADHDERRPADAAVRERLGQPEQPAQRPARRDAGQRHRGVHRQPELGHDRHR